MPEAVLPIVIAEEQVRTTVQATIVLPEEALLVERPNTQVQIDRCRVANNSVFITGRLIINIPFKTGTLETTGGVLTAPITVCGDIRHCTAFIPFSLVADVPGAQEGDQCRILTACVSDLLIERSTTPFDVTAAGMTGALEGTGVSPIDRLNVTAEVCIRFRVTREQTVDVLGTIQPTTRFVTFPSFQ